MSPERAPGGNKSSAPQATTKTKKEGKGKGAAATTPTQPQSQHPRKPKGKGKCKGNNGSKKGGKKGDKTNEKGTKPGKSKGKGKQTTGKSSWYRNKWWRDVPQNGHYAGGVGAGWRKCPAARSGSARSPPNDSRSGGNPVTASKPRSELVLHGGRSGRNCRSANQLASRTSTRRQQFDKRHALRPRQSSRF